MTTLQHFKMLDNEAFDTIENRVKRMGYAIKYPEWENGSLIIRPVTRKFVSAVLAIVVGFLLTRLLVPVWHYLAGDAPESNLLILLFFSVLGGIGFVALVKGIDRLFAMGRFRIELDDKELMIRERKLWRLTSRWIAAPQRFYCEADKEEVRLMCVNAEGETLEVMTEPKAIVATKPVFEHMAKELEGFLQDRSAS